MFKIKRSISSPEYDKKKLFEIASRSISDLIKDWSLAEPKYELFEEECRIRISSKKFKGTVEVRTSTLSIYGNFQSFFRLDKDEVEERLDHWLQSTFHATFDA